MSRITVHVKRDRDYYTYSVTFDHDLIAKSDYANMNVFDFAKMYLGDGVWSQNTYIVRCKNLIDEMIERFAFDLMNAISYHLLKSYRINTYYLGAS